MSGASGLPRLLRGIEDGGTLTLAQHVRVHGPLDDVRPRRGRPSARRRSSDSGLRGRGGAHVSTALKLRAVAGRRRRAVVVANGSESEPASRKDAVLLAHAPHLVIDGAMVAATAVGADEVVLYVKRSDPRVWAAVLRAVDERRAAGAARARPCGSSRRAEQLRQRPGDGGDRAPQRQAGAADDRPAAAVRARRRATARRSSATSRRWRTWR